MSNEAGNCDRLEDEDGRFEVGCVETVVVELRLLGESIISTSLSCVKSTNWPSEIGEEVALAFVSDY